MTSSSHPGAALAGAAGGVLGAVFRTAGTLRPTAKPLHPRGRLVRATLTCGLADPPTGVPVLDERRPTDVVVRISRATGLPAWLPDIHGLAIRIPVEGGVGDILLASTGWGRASRFLLSFGMDPGSRPMTTLFPYLVDGRPVVLGAQVSGSVVRVAIATSTGPFRDVGELVLRDEDGDPVTSFDPVRNRVPGLEVPGWVARLREPAYAGARRSRSDDARAGETGRDPGRHLGTTPR